MAPLGRTLIILGIVLLVVGLLVTYGSRLPIRVGRLPGDFEWRGKSATVYFPLGTCILVSLLFSLISWFFRRH